MAGMVLMSPGRRYLGPDYLSLSIQPTYLSILESFEYFLGLLELLAFYGSES